MIPGAKSAVQEGLELKERTQRHHTLDGGEGATASCPPTHPKQPESAPIHESPPPAALYQEPRNPSPIL